MTQPRQVRHHPFRPCALAILIALGLGCATSPARVLPPLNAEPTGRVAAGKFVWIDLITQDIEASQAFYSALFGWSFEASDNYTRILHDGETIAGIVEAKMAEHGSEWLASLSVADVDSAVATATANGAIIDREPFDFPHRGRMALVSDPEGALILLLRSTSGDPADSEAKIGSWLWRELWSNEPTTAEAFYTALVGYEYESVELDGHPYDVFKAEGVPRAGIVHASDEIHPTWLPYVRVADARATVASARKLGARIFTDDDDMAIIIDPTGAPFGVQVWEPPDEANADVGDAGHEGADQ